MSRYAQCIQHVDPDLAAGLTEWVREVTESFPRKHGT